MKKKLKDICNGFTKNIAQKELDELNGDYEIYGASGLIKKINYYVSEVPYIGIVKDGSGVGRVNSYPAKSSLIGTMQYIVPNNDIDLQYLMYALRSMNLGNLFKGAAIPHIYFKEYKEFNVNVPSLPEQQKIAAHLDSIQSAIDNKKQQLQQLDELVKSKFVEMFGENPVENDRNWIKQPLQEIVSDDCSISYGIVQTGESQNVGVRVFRPIDIVNKSPKFEDLIITKQEISDKYKKTLLHGEELLITVRANIGDTCVVGKEFKGCNVGRGIVPIRTKIDVMNLVFLKYQIDNHYMQAYIKSLSKGITLIQLNMEDLRLIEFIVPPIELQNTFAEYVQKIDSAKSIIKTQLNDLNELLESKMDFYFGE